LFQSYRATAVESSTRSAGFVYGVARMTVAERIRSHSAELTSAERRVAEAILAAPHAVGFGTVADLASAAGAGAATVVRLASKLGYDGFTELQASVQRELMSQLRPAAERIRETGGDTTAARHASMEEANVRGTLDTVDADAIERTVARIADLQLPVAVLSGDASFGVALQFTSELEQLRPGIHLLTGNDVAVRRLLAVLPDTTTLVVADVRRYDRWLLDALSAARRRGMWSAAMTDSVLSPLAAGADATFVLAAGSVGPFDSNVGMLALFDLIVVEVAGRLRATATDRLDSIEQAWRAGDSLTDS
jgi:DNA-binding MurR/RpiR family transcriptional regulator